MTVQALQIGRADAISNTARWNVNGDRVTVTGLIPALPAVAAVMRDQLLGYVDNGDEEVVAVTYSADSTIDGFYRIESASVAVDTPGRATIGWYPYEIQMRRVQQHLLPLIEMIFLGALRTNAAGIVAGTDISWTGVPAAVKTVGVLGAGAWLSSAGTRTGEDGGVSIYWSGSPPTVDHDCRVQYMILPASYYKNAAKIMVTETVGGGTLRTVVGKEIGQRPADWRLTNGLLRVSVVVSGTSVRLSISPYDGAQWDTAINFSFVNHGSGEMTVTTPVAITVLRNSVEEAILRLTLNDGATLDLSLRRGARLVYGLLTEPHSAYKIGIIPTATVAATALTGGLRKTTNDGGGNRLVIASPNTVTKDLATGEVYLTAVGPSFNFAVGFEVPGAASGIDTAQSLVYQYMAADTERITVVGR